MVPAPDAAYSDKIAPFVFVLGMHRSGTSCLAGALEICGLFLGNVRRTGRYNAKGYFELADLVNLHDQILGLNRGTWHNPPTPVQIHPHQMNSLRQFALALSQQRPCGVKDPRLLFLLDGWQEIVKPPHAFVGTFRHPVAVAQSLARRNGVKEEAAYDLWIKYNQKLIELHRQNSFPIIEYRMDSVSSYCEAVSDVATSIGLSPDLSTLRKFVDSKLAHHAASDEAVPLRCQELYTYLQEHKYQPTSSDQIDQSARRSEVKRSISVVQSTLESGVDWIQAAQLERTLRTGSIQQGLFFIGNPRSGTTLVRSLLDAHPMILLGHEINAMQMMENGQSWPQVVRSIIHSSLQFSRQPTWTNYSYQISYGKKLEPAKICIIGDKKAGGTTKILQADPTALMRFLNWVPFPTKFIHCIRHPLDVIATKTRRNRQPIAYNIRLYFAHEATAAAVATVMGSQGVIRLYHEQFVAHPIEELRNVLTALELPSDEGYLQACAALVNPQPHETRHEIDWTPEMLSEIERRTAELPHLSCYLEQSAWQVTNGT